MRSSIEYALKPGCCFEELTSFAGEIVRVSYSRTAFDLSTILETMGKLFMRAVSIFRELLNVKKFSL
jgi:hypothetical protein